MDARQQVRVHPMPLPALQAVRTLIDGYAVPPIHALAFIQIPGSIFLQLVEFLLVHLFKQALFQWLTVLAVQQRVHIGASVYPREVVKQALACNAAAVILVHNHPAGDPAPSDADRRITQWLKDALGLVDIRVIDHVVVGSEGCASFAELGYL